MVVDAARMRENLELTHGALFSQRVLLALVERRARPATTPTGSSSGWRSGRSTSACRCGSCWRPIRPATALDLDAIFDYAPFVRHADEIVGRLDRLHLNARRAIACPVRPLD